MLNKQTFTQVGNAKVLEYKNKCLMLNNMSFVCDFIGWIEYK